MSVHPGGQVRVTDRDDVRWVTLDRQERLNTLSPTMVEQLGEVIDAANQSSAHTVVVTGAGDRVFSAGADVRMLAELAPDEVLETNLLGHQVFDAIERLRKPVIAAIGGSALGGGLELALACDIRIAVDHAQLGLPELGMGVIPGWGGTWRLADAVGHARARELVLTGRLVAAPQAAAYGLVHEVVAPAGLTEAVMTTAATLATRSPDALAAAKAALANARPPSPGQARVESGAVTSLVAGDEFRSRLTEFVDRTRR